MKFFNCLCIILLFFPLFSKACPTPPICGYGECWIDNGTPCPTACGPCAEIPIDGGASLLLIAGGVYGINKIRKYRKLKNS